MIIPLTQSIKSPAMVRTSQNYANSSTYIQQLTDNSRQNGSATNPVQSLMKEDMLQAYEKMLRNEMSRDTNNMSPIKSQNDLTNYAEVPTKGSPSKMKEVQ